MGPAEAIDMIVSLLYSFLPQMRLKLHQLQERVTLICARVKYNKNGPRDEST